MLITYLDGANKADSSRYEVVTLATVVGTQKQFSSFDEEWNRVLGKHGAKFLHTTDAVAGKKEYEGWYPARREALLKDCVKVAGRYLARQRHASEPWRNGLLPSTTTIVLGDFKAAKSSRDDVAETAEELMMRQATAISAVWADIQETETFQFYFDRGESYRGILCDLLASKTARRDAPWLNRVTLNCKANMRDHPGIQLADLFAWCVSNNGNRDTEWQAELLRMDRFDQFIDGDNIAEVIGDSQRIWDTWGINRRAATK